jgi:hypothetical protein
MPVAEVVTTLGLREFGWDEGVRKPVDPNFRTAWIHAFEFLIEI